MRPPVVAGLAPGAGASTLAAALHGVDAGVWAGGPVDVLVARAGAGEPPFGVPVRVLVADALPAADPARAVVVLPVVPQWSEPGGARSAARLLGLTEQRTPADLRPAAAALRAVVGALLRSGALERPCAALAPLPVPAGASPEPPAPRPVRPLVRAALPPAGRPARPSADLPGRPPADLPGWPPAERPAAPPSRPPDRPADPPAGPAAVGRAPSLRAVPVPVRSARVTPVLLHRSAPVLPTLVAGRPLRWAGGDAAGPGADRTDPPGSAPVHRAPVGSIAGRPLPGGASLDRPASAASPSSGPPSSAPPPAGTRSGPPPVRRRALRAGLVAASAAAGPVRALRTG